MGVTVTLLVLVLFGAAAALVSAAVTRRAAAERVDDAIRLLDPGLREVIIQTQAAVDSALLAHRV